MIENNLATIMGARLLSKKALAKGTGISRTTLTDIYYRRTDTVKLSTLIRVCDYLQIPLSELIEYDPSKKTVEV